MTDFPRPCMFSTSNHLLASFIQRCCQNHEKNKNPFEAALSHVNIECVSLYGCDCRQIVDMTQTCFKIVFTIQNNLWQTLIIKTGMAHHGLSLYNQNRWSFILLLWTSSFLHSVYWFVYMPHYINETPGMGQCYCDTWSENNIVFLNTTKCDSLTLM